MSAEQSSEPKRYNPAEGLGQEPDFSIEKMRQGRKAPAQPSADVKELREVAESSGFPSREAPKARPPKPKREPVEQRSYTAPASELRAIAKTQERLVKLGHPLRDAANESWILRLALQLLEDADDATLKRVAKERPPLKRGGPHS